MRNAFTSGVGVSSAMAEFPGFRREGVLAWGRENLPLMDTKGVCNGGINAIVEAQGSKNLVY